MKTTKRNQSIANSKNIVAVKVMAFLSWLLYIGIAFANNLMIEAFVFSVGLVIISYIIFGKIAARKSHVSSVKNNKGGGGDEYSTGHNYLSVFFHSNAKIDLANSNKTMK